MLSACFSFKNQIKDEMVLIPEGIFTMGYNINNKNMYIHIFHDKGRVGI